MPPFQVIQDVPKPDYVGGFFSGASNSLALQQQFRDQQKQIMSTHMQNRFNQILLSPGDAKQKYAAIVDLPNQFKNLSLTDIPEGRAFIQQYIDQMMRENDPYRQAQIKSMNALADYRQEGGAYSQWRQQWDADRDAGVITDEEWKQGIEYKGGSAARPSTQRTTAPKLMRYLDEQGKMNIVSIPSDPESIQSFNEKAQLNKWNLDTRILSTKGNEYEKELSHWTTQFNKTFTKDALGRSVPIPEMEDTRDLAKRKIDELTKKIEAELSHTEPQKPTTDKPFTITPVEFDYETGGPVKPASAPQTPLNINVGYAPGVKPTSAPRSTQAALAATPAQPTSQAAVQATGGMELTQEVIQQFSDAAKKKLGKYAMVSNIRAYAKQLAKAAGYKVD